MQVRTMNAERIAELRKVCESNTPAYWVKDLIAEVLYALEARDKALAECAVLHRGYIDATKMNKEMRAKEAEIGRLREVLRRGIYCVDPDTNSEWIAEANAVLEGKP